MRADIFLILKSCAIARRLRVNMFDAFACALVRLLVRFPFARVNVISLARLLRRVFGTFFGSFSGVFLREKTFLGKFFRHFLFADK
ncbi:MAG: hypothetical protein DBX55_01280 [Verrucomicrobia bacterium]|nr:MAG: hypothetical protein DBX55_01280 [Verrucomicrobiota bacterium]